MKIRSADATDAARVLDIYSHYVEKTAITFECETPTLDELAGRMTTTLQRYPYVVVEDGGRVEGYAYAGPSLG
jgi:phosphinothricin acetyltransferase